MFIHRFSLRIAIAFVSMLAIAAAAAAQPPVQEGIRWRRDLDEAMQLSKADGRPVIAYFTFNACHWCRKLEEDTYSDSSVIEMSRAFHWVKVNRDETPEVPPRFSVSAFPSLITLGDHQEKVHRFSGYMLPEPFKAQLADALRRYDLYRAGQEWDIPDPRPAQICDAPNVTIESFKAPSEEVPAGFAFIGDAMWIAHMGSLFECDAAGKMRRTFPLDGSVLDICTDGQRLYAMTGGWTAGQPIYVIDPATGETARSIIMEANKENRSHGAKGIEFIDGRLYVLEGMGGVIREVDPETGEVLSSIQTSERWITGLAFDGTNFITGGRDRLFFIDRQGATVSSTPVNYPLRSVGWRKDGAGGAVYLMEQPIFDFDAQHQRIRLWPKEMLVYQLRFDAPAKAAAPLGSRENPVRCAMPAGERAYLDRLRCPDGSRPSFTRAGSFGGGPDGHILDGYKVKCAGAEELMIFMDMYHEGYVETSPVPGFTIVNP